jgi:RecJ-like exonuclease
MALSDEMVRTGGALAAEAGDDAQPGTPGTGEDLCPSCSGTGQVEGKPCPNCGGTGKVIAGIGGG